MKKFVTAAALMCFAGVAFAGAPAAVTADPAKIQIKVLAEFYKGSERLYSISQTVPNGETVGLDDIKTREYIKGPVTPQSGTGKTKREPQADKTTVETGFSGYVVPRIQSDGQIRIRSKFSYRELIEKNEKTVHGIDTESPLVALVSAEPQYNATSGKAETPYIATTPHGEYRLVVTATKVE